MRAFCHWLSTTPFSVMIGSTPWLVPAIQTIHILAIAIVLSSVLMLELQILALAGRRRTMAQSARRFMPWLLGGLIVLAATGTLLIIGEPDRSLLNPAFWTKMGLLAASLVATLGLQRVWWRIATPAEFASAPRMLAVTTLLLWCGIAVAGRWIAYVGNQ